MWTAVSSSCGRAVPSVIDCVPLYWKMKYTILPCGVFCHTLYAGIPVTPSALGGHMMSHVSVSCVQTWISMATTMSCGKIS